MSPEEHEKQAAANCNHDVYYGHPYCQPCVVAAIRAAVLEEREACAGHLDRIARLQGEPDSSFPELTRTANFCRKVAAEIRARQ